MTCRDHYLFPDDQIPSMSENELLALIEANLRDAKDCTDGSDIGSDLRIDGAQDIIEQARDQLVRKGYVFSFDEQERLPFLTWPLTAEQEREQALRREQESVAEARYREWARSAEARLNCLFKKLMVGDVLPGEANFDRVEMNIGWNSCTNYADGRTITRPSGAEVLRMQAALVACGSTDATVSIHDSDRARAAFQANLGPFWTMRFSVPLKPAAWQLLLQWWHEHRYQHALHVYYHEPSEDGSRKFTHWPVAAWPDRAGESHWLYGHIGVLGEEVQPNSIGPALRV